MVAPADGGGPALDGLRVVLVSTYELGHQPFALASAAAWLEAAGARVTCNDTAVEPLDEAAIAAARLVALSLPMHTATRLAATLIPRLRALNQDAHLCAFGLYAPVNDDYLRRLGVGTVLGGEFETGLVSLSRRLARGAARQTEPVVSLAKQRFTTPARNGLPALPRYAWLDAGDGRRRVVGYTEASRGCKHLCRHCPVVPVYGGRFRVVQPEVVIADIAAQVAAGAEHITFGDPDFFNGVGHALRIVEALHAAHPRLTYDVTIKIEHLLAQARHLPKLAATGCLFVTTAVESVDDAILERLDKGHSRADFIRAVALARDSGLTLAPTFLPFTPWTTVEGYLGLLRLLVALDLVDQVAPVQLAIRLLVPAGSRILELPEMQARLGEFDPEGLSYAWSYDDPAVDRLQRAAMRIAMGGGDRRETFARLWRLAHDAAGLAPEPLPPPAADAAPAPRLSEPWYCCAEPTEDQLARL